MNCKQTNGRFPDLNNPPKPRWRDALRMLLSPATRMHRYRNLRTAAFYKALCAMDCKDRP